MVEQVDDSRGESENRIARAVNDLATLRQPTAESISLADVHPTTREIYAAIRTALYDGKPIRNERRNEATEEIIARVAVCALDKVRHVVDVTRENLLRISRSKSRDEDQALLSRERVDFSDSFSSDWNAAMSQLEALGYRKPALTALRNLHDTILDIRYEAARTVDAAPTFIALTPSTGHPNVGDVVWTSPGTLEIYGCKNAAINDIDTTTIAYPEGALVHSPFDSLFDGFGRIAEYPGPAGMPWVSPSTSVVSRRFSYKQPFAFLGDPSQLLVTTDSEYGGFHFSRAQTLLKADSGMALNGRPLGPETWLEFVLTTGDRDACSVRRLPSFSAAYPIFGRNETTLEIRRPIYGGIGAWIGHWEQVLQFSAIVENARRSAPPNVFSPGERISLDGKAVIVLESERGLNHVVAPEGGTDYLVTDDHLISRSTSQTTDRAIRPPYIDPRREREEIILTPGTHTILKGKLSWHALSPGTLLRYANGESTEIVTVQPCADLSGHGSALVTAINHRPGKPASMDKSVRRSDDELSSASGPIAALVDKDLARTLREGRELDPLRDIQLDRCELARAHEFHRLAEGPVTIRLTGSLPGDVANQEAFIEKFVSLFAGTNCHFIVTDAHKEEVRDGIPTGRKLPSLGVLGDRLEVACPNARFTRVVPTGEWTAPIVGRNGDYIIDPEEIRGKNSGYVTTGSQRKTSATSTGVSGRLIVDANELAEMHWSARWQAEVQAALGVVEGCAMRGQQSVLFVIDGGETTRREATEWMKRGATERGYEVVALRGTRYGDRLAEDLKTGAVSYSKGCGIEDLNHFARYVRERGAAMPGLETDPHDAERSFEFTAVPSEILRIGIENIESALRDSLSDYLRAAGTTIDGPLSGPLLAEFDGIRYVLRTLDLKAKSVLLHVPTEPMSILVSSTEDKLQYGARLLSSVVDSIEQSVRAAKLLQGLDNTEIDAYLDRFGIPNSSTSMREWVAMVSDASLVLAKRMQFETPLDYTIRIEPAIRPTLAQITQLAMGFHESSLGNEVGNRGMTAGVFDWKDLRDEANLGARFYVARDRSGRLIGALEEIPNESLRSWVEPQVIEQTRSQGRAAFIEGLWKREDAPASVASDLIQFSKLALRGTVDVALFRVNEGNQRALYAHSMTTSMTILPGLDHISQVPSTDEKGGVKSTRFLYAVAPWSSGAQDVTTASGTTNRFHLVGEITARELPSLYRLDEEGDLRRLSEAYRKFSNTQGEDHDSLSPRKHSTESTKAARKLSTILRQLGRKYGALEHLLETAGIRSENLPRS